MLGKSHFIAGSTLYLGISLVVKSEFINNSDFSSLFINTLLAGIGGLLPDLDHHTSKSTKSFGFVTKIIHKVISFLSNGHRKGTHSLLALLFLSFLFFIPNLIQNFWAPIIYILPIIFIILLPFFLSILITNRIIFVILLTVFNVLITKELIYDYSSKKFASLSSSFFIPIIVGYFSHLLTDTFTTNGVPWFYPLKTKLRLPFLGNTGSQREIIFTFLNAGLLIIFFLYFVYEKNFLPWKDIINLF